MVKVKRDLTGQTFGKLRVLKQVEDYVTPSGRRHPQWLCQCDCGSKPIEVLGTSLKSGHTRSCGCIHEETLK